MYKLVNIFYVQVIDSYFFILDTSSANKLQSNFANATAEPLQPIVNNIQRGAADNGAVFFNNKILSIAESTNCAMSSELDSDSVVDNSPSVTVTSTSGVSVVRPKQLISPQKLTVKESTQSKHNINSVSISQYTSVSKSNEQSSIVVPTISSDNVLSGSALSGDSQLNMGKENVSLSLLDFQSHNVMSMKADKPQEVTKSINSMNASAVTATMQTAFAMSTLQNPQKTILTNKDTHVEHQPSSLAKQALVGESVSLLAAEKIKCCPKDINNMSASWAKSVDLTSSGKDWFSMSPDEAFNDTDWAEGAQFEQPVSSQSQ